MGANNSNFLYHGSHVPLEPGHIIEPSDATVQAKFYGEKLAWATQNPEIARHFGEQAALKASNNKTSENYVYHVERLDPDEPRHKSQVIANEAVTTKGFRVLSLAQHNKDSD